MPRRFLASSALTHDGALRHAVVGVGELGAGTVLLCLWEMDGMEKLLVKLGVKLGHNFMAKAKVGRYHLLHRIYTDRLDSQGSQPDTRCQVAEDLWHIHVLWVLPTIGCETRHPAVKIKKERLG